VVSKKPLSTYPEDKGKHAIFICLFYFDPKSNSEVPLSF
jgi:hypothetical protein